MTVYRVSALSAESPDMSAPEFRELAESIRMHGQLVPIWKSGDEIIDGRKRLRACQQLGIEPKVVDVMTGQSAEDIAYALNILRTHYTSSQRAMFAEKRATATRWDSARIRDSGKRSPVNMGEIVPVSVPRAAREAGVSESAVGYARALRRDAAVEVVEAVEAGALTLHSAQQIVKTTPKENQPEAVRKVVEAAKGSRSRTPVREALGQPRPPRRSHVPPLALRMERGLDQLETTVDLLAQFVEEGEIRAGWTRRLEEARTKLGRVINAARRG